MSPQLPEPIRLAIESGRVPSPPQMLLRLLQMVDDDRATMAELAALVGQDPGLTARVLTAANSPALRRGGELHSLESCLIALGTRLIRSIATCLSIRNLFERRTGLAGTDLTAFWAHSLVVAELARNLAAATGYPRPEEAYLAGLLHDVGELILLTALGEPYAELLAACPGEAELPARESARFGVHHGEIGTWLSDHWRLDSAFADGILFHHAEQAAIAGAAPLPQVVWLAHALTEQADIPPALATLYQTLFDRPEAGQLAALRALAEQRTTQIAEALNFSLPPRLSALPVWAGRQLAAPPAAPVAAAEDEMSALLGGMALLQPLQQGLFELESEAEILLSLRESARILFDLNKLAFLLATPPDGALSGKTIGGQPAIFRQVDLPLDERRSLAAAAALRRQILASFDAVAGPPPSLIDRQFARALGCEGLLLIPLIARDRTCGVMVCGLSQAQYGRLQRRLPWLLNFGRIAAISLDALREARDCRAQAEHDAASRYTRQARRVIHEAGNPLGIIKSYLKILDRKLPAETGVRQELGILTEEIDRVAGIVARMSEIPQVAAGSGLNVGELVGELLLLYGEPLFQARGIKLESSLPAEPLRVGCDRDSLKQMLLNLWKNASEALGAGQWVRISLSDHVVHDGRAYIRLRIDDNGPGMSEAAMRAIHRPPADIGQGRRGMGLAIVGALAAGQGIPVTCRSQLGQGTSIALLLPKFEPQATGRTDAEAAAGQAAPRPGTEEP